MMYSDLWWVVAGLVGGENADLFGQVLGVGLDGDAGMGGVDVPGLRGGVELLQAGVHEVEREADDDGGDDDADHERDLLQARRGADDVAGLEVLRGVAGVGGGDADDAADGDGESAEGWGGPALDEEDGAGGHERGDGHAGDGTGRGADEADDARADGDEEKSEDDDEQRGGEIGGPCRHMRRGRA